MTEKLHDDDEDGDDRPYLNQIAEGLRFVGDGKPRLLIADEDGEPERRPQTTRQKLRDAIRFR